VNHAYHPYHSNHAYHPNILIIKGTLEAATEVVPNGSKNCHQGLPIASEVILGYISAMQLLYIDYLLNMYRLETIGASWWRVMDNLKVGKWGKPSAKGTP
jgi:hypothetical protein